MDLALERIQYDAVVEAAGALRDAEAAALTPFGATSLGWTREEVFGEAGNDEDMLTLSQSIELAGRTGRRAAAARARGAADRHAADARKNAYITQTRHIFHDARLAMERAQVYRLWRDQVTHANQRLKLRVKAGAEAGWANQHSHHELARAELLVARSEAKQDALSAQLLALIGWRPGVPAPSLSAPELPTVMPGGVNTYLARLAAHPTSLMLEAQLRSGALQREAGARSWVPDLQVSVGYKTATTADERGHGYAAGAQLSAPLWGDPTGEQALGRAEILRAKHELRLWTSEHAAKVRRAYVMAERLIAVATKASEHLAHGHERLLAAAQLAYQGGEIDLDGLLEAHADARDDRLQAIDLKRQAWRAVVNLDHLTGRSL